MATKKTSSKALVPWEEKFAKYTKDSTESVKNIGSGGLSVRFRPGSIEVGGLTVPNNRLECVVLGNCAFNAYYEGKYDPDNPAPPDCYAFAIVDDEEMAPHADCTDPQAETCHTCEKNEYGSAETGRGKACGNKQRLALFATSDIEEAENISTAELAMAVVSPTNLKAWAGYVRAVAEEHGRPPWGVITQISAHSDPKTQIRLEFKLVDLIEDVEVLDALESRLAKVQEFLQQPFAPMTEAPAKKTPAKKSSRKFAGKQ